MCGNLSFIKSAIGFGLQNFDTTWMPLLCSFQTSNLHWEIFGEGPWKMAFPCPVQSARSWSTVQSCGSVWVPHCGVSAPGIVGQEPCSISFMSQSCCFPATHWIGSLLHFTLGLTQSCKLCQAQKKSGCGQIRNANKNRKYSSQLWCSFYGTVAHGPQIHVAWPSAKGRDKQSWVLI